MGWASCHACQLKVKVSKRQCFERLSCLPRSQPQAGNAYWEAEPPRLAQEPHPPHFQVEPPFGYLLSPESLRTRCAFTSVCALRLRARLEACTVRPLKEARRRCALANASACAFGTQLLPNEAGSPLGWETRLQGCLTAPEIKDRVLA